MQGGIRTNSAPPTPLSKRRHRPAGYHRPRLPATSEMNDDDDDDDDENGMRPIAIADFRKKAKQKMDNLVEQQQNMGIGSL